MSAEQDDGRRQIGLQTHLFAKHHRIDVVFHVEIGTQNHSRCLKNMGVVVAKGQRLLDGALGSGNDVLLLQWLNPEARRIVGQVRNECHERPTGVDGFPAFADLAIKVGNDGDEEIRRMVAPEFFEKANHGAVKEPYRKLQNLQEILAAQSPAVLQHDVVLLLDADAGEFAEYVKAVR